MQCRCGLSQVNDVTGIRELIEDLVLHVQGQITECHASAHLLGDLEVVQLLLPFNNGFQTAQPDVDVSHEDTPAMDGQTVQGGAQVL